MADNISSLKISVDSSEVKNATNNLNNLTGVSGRAEGTTTNLIGGFTKLKAGALAAAAAVGALAKAGVEYNAQIEKLTNGLTTLNVLTSKNVDSNGKAIALEQKYNLARRESIETMQKLNAINLETPHTLDQTVQIYKSMYTSMKTVGVSSEQMIDLTKKLSIAAGSSGIEFQQLLAGIDGLATGTVEVSSELGRFLKSIGLTNEELKKSSNIYETINNKVKDVKGIIGYKEAVSNLGNSFDQLTGALVEPFFDDVKDGITGLAGMFNDLTKSVTLFYEKFKSISELTTKDQLNRRAVEVATKIAEQRERLANAFDFNKGKYAAELRASELELLAINQQFEAMNKLNDVKLVANGIERNQAEITKISGNELAKFNLALDENIQKLKKAGATEKEINEFRAEELKKFNEKQEKSNKEAIKSAEELNNALKEMSQVGMNDYQIAIESIKDKTAEWIVAGVNINDVLTAQKTLLEELNIQQALNSASDELSFLEKKAQLMTDEYEKSRLLLEIKYAQSMIDIQKQNLEPEDKQRLIEQETELYNLTLQRIELDRNTEFQDTMSGFYDDMLESQISLNGAVYDFGESFGEVGTKISNATKSLISLTNTELKYKKELGSVNDKYAKEYKKYAGDVEKTKKLEISQSKEIDKLNKANFNNQLTSVGEIAGTFKNFFDEQSTGYKVLHSVEQGMHAARMAMMLMELPQTLALTAAKWGEAAAGATASVTTAGTGDPYTAPARVALMIGLMAAAMTMFGGSGGSGGGSGGGAAASPYSTAELANAEITKMEDQTAIDLMQQQVDLLEAIEKNGSAQKLSVNLAAAKFTQAKNEWVQDIFDQSRLGYVAATFNTKSAQWASIQKHYEDLKTINPFEMLGDKIRLNTDLIRKNVDDFITILGDMSTFKRGEGYSYSGPVNQKIMEKYGYSIEGHEATLSQIRASFSEIQGYLNDWAISVVDSVSELKDSSESMKGFYDDITGSDFYANQKLLESFSNFDKLLNKGESYSDYLVKNINQIEDSTKFIYELSGILDEKGKELTNYELLLSKNGDLIEEQMAKVADFGKVTENAFSGGVEEAINYIDSIEAVAEAMTTSRNNMMSFANSFKSEDMLLNQQSMKIGMPLAKDFDELASQFKKLSSDMFGLTDDELKYLDASKSMIEKKNEELLNIQQEAVDKQIESYEEYINTITKDISTIESAMSSMTSIINKLRDQADTTNTYTLSKFNESMSQTLNLMKGKDYKAIQDSLKDTISYSSALNDSKNFELTRDMRYAQLVAANQFESMDTTLQTEVDYLKQIEKNTRATVLSLQVQLEKMTNSTVNSNDKLAGLLDEYISNSQNKNYKTVQDLYTKYDLHQFQKDNAGYEYWTKELNEGKPLSQLENEIKLAAIEVTKGMNTPAAVEWLKKFNPSGTNYQEVYDLYTKYDLHQFQTDNSGYKVWEQQLNMGKTLSEVENEIKRVAKELLQNMNTPEASKWLKKFGSFAVGTPYVERDMMAKIHEGEIITPKNFSDGLRNGDLVMGQTANMVNAINNMGALLSQNVANLENKLNAIISITGTQVNKLVDIYDVSNGSLVSLQNIEGII